MPAAASAHGGRQLSADDVAYGVAAVGPYQILLEKPEKPPAVGFENFLKVRLLDTRTQRLVSGREVLIGINLPQAKPRPAEEVVGAAALEEGDPSRIVIMDSPLEWNQDGSLRLEGFLESQPADDEGHYQVRFRPFLDGTHLVKVVVLPDPGDKTALPLVAQFPIKVSPAPGANWALWTVAALVVLMALALLAGLWLRMASPSSDPRGYNWLDLPGLKAFARWRGFQTFFQLPNLAVFGLIIVLGFLDTQSGSRNLATKLTWTIWWAGVIFTFVLVGRVWCLMCPFGAVTDWINRAVSPVRRLPRWLRNLWLANLLFLFLTWLDGYYGVVSNPRLTAWIILAMFALAAIVGALLQRRSFCRYFCPIGGLISIYSMVSPVELRIKDPKICQAHRSKDCYVGDSCGYGCPMFEFPQRMDANNYCNFCCECVKTCSEDNISVRLRTFGKDLWASATHRFDESFLAVALVGVSIVVTGHMLLPWHEWLDGLAHYLPFEALGIHEHTTIEKIMFSVLLIGGSVALAPGLMLGVAWTSRSLAGANPRVSLKRVFTVFGYMLVPVGLAMHLSHNLRHLLLEGWGVVPVVQKTINAYTSFFAGTPDFGPKTLVAEPAVYWLQMTLLVGFFWLSLLSGWRLSRALFGDGREGVKALMPMVALALVFMLVNIYFLNQPMNPRHFH
jgi:polyferredoxin